MIEINDLHLDNSPGPSPTKTSPQLCSENFDNKEKASLENPSHDILNFALKLIAFSPFPLKNVKFQFRNIKVSEFVVISYLYTMF